MQAHTQYQTWLLKYTHTCSPSHREDGVGGSKHRDPAHPQNALLVHTHSSAHMRTHPKEVEQRAQRQHVEAPVETLRCEERTEDCKKTLSLKTFQSLVKWGNITSPKTQI